MKKFLACTLALTMTAAMFASCGKTSSSSVADTDSAAETTAADAASSDATSDAASDATSDADSSAADSSAAETTKSDDKTTTKSDDGKTTTAAKSDDGKTTTAAKSYDGKTTTTAKKSDSKTTTTTAKKEASKAKPISDIPSTLASYSKASVKFKTSMKVSDFVASFNEDKGKGAYIPNTDESKTKLSIKKVAGIPMLRVQTLQHIKNNAKKDWGIPKIRFDVSKLFKGQESQLPKIFTIKADVVTMAVGKFTGDDGVKKLVPGNFMGAFCTQTGKDVDKLSWNDLYDFGEAEWDSQWGSYELTMRPGIMSGATFENTTSSQYVSLMKWSMPNQADYYIADLTFLDENNNVIKCAKFQ